MYATISLAAYKQAAAQNQNTQQSGVLFPPPEGPYSAYLVFQQDEDEREEEQGGCCWPGCYNRLKELPFPQDKCLSIRYTTNNGQNSRTERNKTYFIPVLGQPISSNRYYVIRAERKHKG